MIDLPDAPDIRRAYRTGYGYEYHDTESEYFSEDGSLSEEEAIDYMIEYVRKNPAECSSLLPLGIEYTGGDL